MIQKTLENPNKKPQFCCENCDFITNNKKDFNKHLTTSKHMRNSQNSGDDTNDTKMIHKTPKNPKKPKKKPQKTQIFFCENCDFNSNNNKDFNKHIITSKHIKNSQNNIKITCDLSKKNIFTCHCGKIYKYHSGLWRHKNNCNMLETIIIKDNECDKELIIDKSTFLSFVKQNQEFKDLIIEQNKKMVELQQTLIGVTQNNITNNNNINSNNKTFNLHIFLNETCKDAMNIMDFVDSLKVKLSDLENVGKLGYIDGISNIIVNNLKALDISKRPLHCSDLKREILYVKDKDKWEKENEEKKRLKLAIKHVAHKNIQMIPEWKLEHPEYENDEGKMNDQYLKIVMGSMDGSDEVCDNKIISKLAKSVIIEKSETPII
jgi:hypothetical protein